MGLYFRLLEQDFVRYTIDCIIEMASGNRFAALADLIADSGEVPNQASTAERDSLCSWPPANSLMQLKHLACSG